MRNYFWRREAKDIARRLGLVTELVDPFNQIFAKSTSGLIWKDWHSLQVTPLPSGQQVSPAQPTPSTGGRRRAQLMKPPRWAATALSKAKNRADVSLPLSSKAEAVGVLLEKKAEELTSQNIQLSVSGSWVLIRIVESGKWCWIMRKWDNIVEDDNFLN